jgi:hypothetical protein
MGWPGAVAVGEQQLDARVLALLSQLKSLN